MIRNLMIMKRSESLALTSLADGYVICLCSDVRERGAPKLSCRNSALPLKLKSFWNDVDLNNVWIVTALLMLTLNKGINRV